MKKIVSAFLALQLALFSIPVINGLPVAAAENYGIEPYESDWPDYNYGNWQDVIANPTKYAKVATCIVQATGLNLTDAVKLLSGSITFWAVAAQFGIQIAWDFTTCLWG
ncbi:hypothetical protein [uncultured Faecalibaculum sp.]|uniref:hypothetical protein n=1 Tax=uncultured Faecalibaculum sp. TaxID=1729681 RepID=UPI002711F6CB|nr:hypothetical protein [uncultured Faecalibaculum sp.]